MYTRKGMTSPAGKSILLATVAALCLAGASPSLAAPVTGSEATTASGRATDFSAARRHHHHYHHYYYAGNEPAAFVGAAVGLVGGAIAADQREYYDWGPYGPGYYNGPVYYNPYYPYAGRGYYYPF